MPTRIRPAGDSGPDTLLARLRAHVERVKVRDERAGLRQVIEDFDALDRLCSEGVLPTSWARFLTEPEGAPSGPKIDPEVQEHIIALIRHAMRGTYSQRTDGA